MPLVVHFHGASWLIERHVAKSAPFADPTTFSSLLADAAQAATRLRGRPTRWSGVTLTSFSAGYGAVRAILSQPGDAARISA
jgi:hypothetical protein